MESDPDKLVHIVDSVRVGTRFSKVGFASMCLVEVANGMGLSTLRDAVAISGQGFGFSDAQMRILFVVYFANGYVSPFFAALFADLQVGKYRAILFSAGMRTFANVILLAIALVLSLADKPSPTWKSTLFGIYIFGLIFQFVSDEFLTSLLMPFGIQQVNQQSGMAMASAARWLMWFYDVGIVFSTFVGDYLRSRYKEHLMVVEAGMSCVAACIMISVFILGKGYYNRTTTDEGRASFAALLNIIKGKFCFLPSYRVQNEPMTLDRDEDEQYRLHQRIKVERLILRKSFLMLGFFACIAVSQVIYYKMLFMTISAWCKAKGCREVHTFSAGHVTLFAYVPFLVLTPILEWINWRRRQGHGYLAGVNFKSMGVGFIMAALAALAAAMFCQFKQRDDGTTWEYGWLIPAFMALGTMSFLTFIKAIEFCYTESFKGLECFTTSLMCSLWMFIYTFITYTEGKWGDEPYNVAIFLYTLFGAMVGTTLFIYIPVAIWYNKLKEEITETRAVRHAGYGTLT